MYSFPSTSQIFGPSARSIKKGALPTLRNARTGEFTPPGMRFCAVANNLDEREAIETECKRPTSNIERPTLNSDAVTPTCRHVDTGHSAVTLPARSGGVAKW